jgi:hypothetical protein
MRIITLNMLTGFLIWKLKKTGYKEYMVVEPNFWRILQDSREGKPGKHRLRRIWGWRILSCEGQRREVFPIEPMRIITISKTAIDAPAESSSSSKDMEDKGGNVFTVSDETWDFQVYWKCHIACHSVKFLIIVL